MTRFFNLVEVICDTPLLKITSGRSKRCLTNGKKPLMIFLGLEYLHSTNEQIRNNQNAYKFDKYQR